MQTCTHPFAPFIDSKAKILILGSFPSIKSFEDNFYYAHPKNQFWKLLAGVFKEDEPKTIQDKKRFLKRYNVALWDMIKSCRRQNSLDSNLKDIKVNDITKLLKSYLNIKKIFFTSKTALKYYEKNFKHLSIQYDYLPSPSPAYATMKFEDKLAYWTHSFGLITIDEFLMIIDILKQNLPQKAPLNELQNSYKRNPYTILMVTLLSLRSKDERTAQVAKRLFNSIQTPKELLELSQKELEEIIKPIGFYKQKAKTILEVSKILAQDYSGNVPRTKEELIKIKGIGEKTANIILNEVYNKDIIAADTHVHRLCNMFGLLQTKSFNDSSRLLNKIIPNIYKRNLNHILVSFGQTICLPKSPKCDKCKVKRFCKNAR